MTSEFDLYQFVAFDNDFDTDDRAWNPEFWAAETLAILEENMVVGRLVHTDFSDEIKDFGDTVNTRKPGEFTAKRKGVNDDVEVQSATADTVAVVLNQHVHTSFLIRDSEQSKSFKDLLEQYLAPAATSLARYIDLVLLGQVYQFLDNSYGDLDTINATAGDAHNAKNLMLGVRNVQNKKKVSMTGRNLIITPDTETSALALDLFISAEQVGDEGTALREASLGRKLGYNTFQCQNTPSVVDTGVLDADDADALPLGDLAFTSDGAAGAGYVAGQYIYFVDGTTATLMDKSPHRITLIAGDVVTFDRPIRVAMPSANNDVYLVPMGAVALAEHTLAGGPTAYPAGYDKEIYVDGTGVPQIGQLCSFNNAATLIAGEYCIIDVTAIGAGVYSIGLDRPLDNAIANNYTVGYGPGGDYNFAFTRGALALVNRPLAVPKVQGVSSGVASYNGLSMRVTMTYDGNKQGTLVTLDMLCGVKVLDEDQGAVLIA
jgi:hypothetical protein